MIWFMLCFSLLDTVNVCRCTEAQGCLTVCEALCVLCLSGSGHPVAFQSDLAIFMTVF